MMRIEHFPPIIKVPIQEEGFQEGISEMERQSWQK